jgi:hypothetical protein
MASASAGAVEGLVSAVVGSDFLLQAATEITAQRMNAARLSMAASPYWPFIY